MNINGEWLLACSLCDQTVPLNIPGNFEQALWQANIIDDPYINNNSIQLRKFEFAVFTLEKEFKLNKTDGRSYRLTLDGVDGIADVFVNNKYIGECRNSFIAHTFILKDELDKSNTIRLVFKSCIEEMKKYPLRSDMYSSYNFNAEAARFRRPAHIWGWDIFPRMALGGVFNGIFIEEIPESYIEEYDLATLAIDGTSSAMRLAYKVVLPSIADGNSRITISGKCGNSTFCASQKLRSYCGFIHFNIDNTKLWWPKKYGASPLYDVKLTLETDGTVQDEKLFTFGVRTCSLIAKPIATESSEPDFQFIINGRKIRVFGTNHVPLDALHARSIEKYEQFFALANECGVDMLRIWGGGVYEPDGFYGILVWQDFMMGCAIYPQDEEFKRELAKEAEFTIKRLRRHCSIVLWAGDNECDVAPSWGRLDVAPESNKLTREVLSSVCRHNDITRPYLPSSPWCSPEAQAAAPVGTDPTLLAPEQHLWGPRDYFKSDFYRNSKASFLSEFGYHGAPCVSSIEKFIASEFRYPLENDICRHHASNPFLPDDTNLNFRITLMYDQIREFFGESVPDNLQDFVTASQIVQAEALKFLIELFKMKKKCSGLLWWNLIDGWPQFSDAVVDYYGEKKLAFHILKRLHKKLLITLSESNAWHRSVLAANDSAEQISGSYIVKEFSTGNVASEGVFLLAPGAIETLDSFKVCTTKKELYLIEFDIDGKEKFFNHYLAGFPQFDYNFFKDNYLEKIYGDIL